MIAAIKQALTSRMAGPAASAVALALVAVLATAWGGWQAERAELEGRIGELMQQSERSQSLWRAQLAACHAAGARQLTEAEYAAPSKADGDAAQRLLAKQPEGIDVCARMESADQAVLSTLK